MRANKIKIRTIMIMLFALLFNMTLVFLLLTGISSLYAKASTRTGDVINFAENKTKFFLQELFGKYFGENMNGSQRSDDESIVAMQNQFDVLNYDLSLSFDIPNKSISGVMTMTANSLSDTLRSVYLNLYSNMKAESVDLNNDSQSSTSFSDCPFKQENDYLIIILNSNLKKNQKFRIKIKYSGKPKSMGFDSFMFKEIYGNPVIYNLSEPNYGPTWWPSKDLPDDKALPSMHLKVPRGFKGVSNGLLIDSVQNDDSTTTFNWKSTYPIATYLMSLVVTKFSYWEDIYTSLDSSIRMPLTYYVFPRDSANSREDWSVTPQAIHLYSSIYGEYPFINEKYGMAEFGWSMGSMEHQTLTSMGYVLVSGGGNEEDVIVHELAHQWFGDAVTLKDWKNIWLNEGFATYSEALWHEYKYGKDDYLRYMKKTDYGFFSGTVYAPEGFIFSPSVYATVYQKGGWVLHMLRGVLGDTLFFKTLRIYYERFKYSNAETKDFQAVAEEISGQNLDWFFDEWIYNGTGRPKYEYSWKFEDFQDQPNSGKYTVRLLLKQVQDDMDVYKMPVKVTVETENGDKVFTVFNDKREQNFLFAVDSKPKEVKLDGDGWILKKVAKGKY